VSSPDHYSFFGFPLAPQVHAMCSTRILAWSSPKIIMVICHWGHLSPVSPDILFCNFVSTSVIFFQLPNRWFRGSPQHVPHITTCLDCGGSFAAARRQRRRQRDGGGSLAVARRRRQLGGSAEVAAWRRSRGGSRAVAAHSVTAAAAWRWRGSGGSLAAARRQRQRGGGAQRNGGGSLAAAAWRRRGGGGSAVTGLSVIAAAA
jgi:hypothetical protein